MESSSGPAPDPSRFSQGAKLSEEEQKLVARIFSDPTFFPVEFRTWLKNFMEGSGMTLPASAIIGLPKPPAAFVAAISSGEQTGLMPGIIISFATTPLPLDCLPCDGAVVSRTDYAKLFDVIGTDWGAGDGSTTFGVPNLTSPHAGIHLGITTGA